MLGSHVSYQVPGGALVSALVLHEFGGADVMASVKETVPLSATMAEDIDALRQWCKGRARPAGG